MTSNPPHDFLWAVGIEDTAIGVPVRDGGRTLDEYELTGHYDRWRADLDLVTDLGCTALRYGLPWYRINPAPGQWDWAWLDGVIDYAARSAGLRVIADLVHYGTPGWLSGSFTDPRYPEAISAFAAAVADRYGDLISCYTPLNEPLVTASFCGERAVWPPYGHGDAGWAAVITAVVRGMQATIAALRAVRPEAAIVHVEATNVWNTADEDLSGEVEFRRLRNFLPTDLLTGRVTPEHPLHGWLLDLGVAQRDLDELRAHAAVPDIVGVNYYPQLSCRELVRLDGEIAGVAVDGGHEGLMRVLREFHARYELPMLVSETGVEGSAGDQIEWLRCSTRSVFELRDEGVPIAGYTWWPLFDFVDWSWASAGRVVEEFRIRDSAGEIRPVLPPGRGDDVESYLRRMGLYRLERGENGLRRCATEAVPAFRSITRPLWNRAGKRGRED